jgi:tetratricopeptide (TPR) repeat protein
MLPLLLILSALPLAAQSLEEVSARAQAALQTGRLREAIPLLEQLRRAAPDHPGVSMNLGIVHQKLGEDEKAVPYFRHVLKLTPKDARAAAALGASLMKLGQFPQAIPPLRQAVEAMPDNAALRQMLADAHLFEQKFPEGAAHYQKLAEIDPQNPRAWYGLGKCYEELAVHAFQSLEKAAPESGWWLRLVADARLRQRQFSSAFFLYRRALEKNQRLFGIREAVAEIYRQTGNPQWAAIEESKALAPDCAVDQAECAWRAQRYNDILTLYSANHSPEAHYWRALVYNQLAAQAFDRLAALGPSAESHEIRALIHRNQGRHREAVEQWRKALALRPADWRLSRELAISLHDARDFDALLDHVGKLLKVEPDNPEWNFLYGDTLLARQQVQNALPYLRQAVRQDPSLLAAKAALGRALMQTGSAAEAAPLLEAALGIDTDGSLHFQLARALQAVGQPEKARQVLAKYQEISNALREQQRTALDQVKVTPP